jgi:acylphosphatase
LNKHISIKVSGKVQGVYFRDSTQKEAKKLDICGFVRNEKDGSVYIEAEGKPTDLERFKEWCKVGPSAAKVTKIVVEEAAIKGFEKFEMKYQ